MACTIPAEYRHAGTRLGGTAAEVSAVGVHHAEIVFAVFGTRAPEHDPGAIRAPDRRDVRVPVATRELAHLPRTRVVDGQIVLSQRCPLHGDEDEAGAIGGPAG